jgi:hypothetical protein
MDVRSFPDGGLPRFREGFVPPDGVGASAFGSLRFGLNRPARRFCPVRPGDFTSWAGDSVAPPPLAAGRGGRLRLLDGGRTDAGGVSADVGRLEWGREDAGASEVELSSAIGALGVCRRQRSVVCSCRRPEWEASLEPKDL